MTSLLFKYAEGEKTIRGKTTNGMETLKTTTDPIVDLFFIAGASRNKDITPAFQRAFKEDKDLATRVLLWTRDVRGGSGERDTFRSLFKWLIAHDEKIAMRVMEKIPELGRWDDLLEAVGTPLQYAAFSVIREGLLAKNGLCGKWMPRKGMVAVQLRKYLGLKPKEYRDYLVALSKTVEQQMCANQWSEINFSHVPSQASSRYQKAFGKHEPVRYAGYLKSLQKGEKGVKINAGAVFPHDVVRACITGNAGISNEQWKALPNYMKDSKERIIPVVDVSGSMSQGISGAVTAMDISVSLGLYISERNEGLFKDSIVTFSAVPHFVQLKKKNLIDRVNELKAVNWDMNTNLEAVFNLLLATAVNNKLPEDQMPTKVLILSDMEFDAAIRSTFTAHEMIAQKYAASGYKMPDVVYWNIAANGGNNPVRAHQTGAALVSGYSPAILASILGADMEQFTPRAIMLKTIMSDRYSF